MLTLSSTSNFNHTGSQDVGHPCACVCVRVRVRVRACVCVRVRVRGGRLFSRVFIAENSPSRLCGEQPV